MYCLHSVGLNGISTWVHAGYVGFPSSTWRHQHTAPAAPTESGSKAGTFAWKYFPALVCAVRTGACGGQGPRSHHPRAAGKEITALDLAAPANGRPWVRPPLSSSKPPERALDFWGRGGAGMRDCSPAARWSGGSSAEEMQGQIWNDLFGVNQDDKEKKPEGVGFKLEAYFIDVLAKWSK